MLFLVRSEELWGRNEFSFVEFVVVLINLGRHSHRWTQGWLLGGEKGERLGFLSLEIGLIMARGYFVLLA